MKKLLALMLCMMMFLGTVAVGVDIPSFAATKVIKIYVDGRELMLDKKPVVEKGVLMLPAQALVEGLDGSFYYDAKAKHLWCYRGAYIFDAVLGQPTADKSDGYLFNMKAPAKLINGVPYIPLNAVSDGLACTVKYDAAKGILQIKRTKLHLVNDITKLQMKNVVKVETNRGFGTGILFNKSGEIVTNAHVIKRARWIKVTTQDKKVYDAVVVKEDSLVDLAQLKLKTSKKNFDFVPYYSSYETVNVGDPVVAIGHPLGFENTVSSGTVSAIHQKFEELNGISMYQSTAPISPGNSGGPLFNESGEIIGINTLVASRGQNLNFAVPIDYYIDGLDQNPNGYSMDIYELYEEGLYWGNEQDRIWKLYDGMDKAVEAEEKDKILQMAKKAQPEWLALQEEVKKTTCTDQNADAQAVINRFTDFINATVSANEELIKYGETGVPNQMYMAYHKLRDSDMYYSQFYDAMMKIK